MVKWKAVIVTIALCATLAPIATNALYTNTVNFNYVTNSMAMIGASVAPDMLVSLFCHCLLGTQPFVAQNFGVLVIPLSDIVEMVAHTRPSSEALDTAFDALQLGYDDLVALLRIKPMNYNLVRNLGLTIDGMLTAVLKSISCDLDSFIALVTLAKWNPDQLEKQLKNGSESDIFNLMQATNITSEDLREIADILGIDLKLGSVMDFFEIFTIDFALRFCDSITNDLVYLLDVVGIRSETLIGAADLLTLEPEILHVGFIQRIMQKLAAPKLFANFISNYYALTKKGSVVENIYHEMYPLVNLEAAPLVNPINFIPITLEETENFVVVNATEPVTQNVFQVMVEVATSDLYNCIVPVYQGAEIASVVTFVEVDDGKFYIHDEDMPELVEGTPLICANYLVGIYDQLEGTRLRFTPPAEIKIKKGFHMKDPLFDWIHNVLTYGKSNVVKITARAFFAMKNYMPFYI